MNTLNSQRTSASSPGWAWLVTGSFAGLFIAFLVHLAKTPFNDTSANQHSFSEPSQYSEPVQNTSKRPRLSQNNSIEPTLQKRAPAQKFNFYTQLPQAEVFPNRKTVLPAENNSAKEHNALSVTRANTESTKSKYMIQVGSFNRITEAEQLRVEIILLGLTPSIEIFESDAGKKWHRVLLGPFDEQQGVVAAKSQLKPLNLVTTTQLR